MQLLFMACRAGNLVVPNLGAEVISDVSSSSGPVKLEDLQRILSNIEPAGIGLLHGNSCQCISTSPEVALCSNYVMNLLQILLEIQMEVTTYTSFIC